MNYKIKIKVDELPAILDMVDYVDTFLDRMLKKYDGDLTKMNYGEKGIVDDMLYEVTKVKDYNVYEDTLTLVIEEPLFILNESDLN